MSEPLEIAVEPVEAPPPAPEEAPPIVTLELHHDPRDNMGEIFRAESHPADPLKDELTRELTHRGGASDPRTEFY